VVARRLAQSAVNLVRRPETPWPDASAALQIVHCSHHKVGTVWFTQALRAVAREYGLVFARGGERGAADADVVLYRHSREFSPDRSRRAYSGSHMIRDPRDVVVSGYHYHLHTNESWVHVPREEWGGATYQDHLTSLPQHEGLLVEIRRASGGALRDMGTWSYRQPEFIELRYEDVIGNEWATFRDVFLHHGFTTSAAERAADLCDTFSFDKQAGRAVGTVDPTSHLRSGKPEQWRELFTDEHRRLFEELNPGLVEHLGYRWD
jgi:hypothetical protein